MLGISALPKDQLDFILHIADEIEPMVKAQDMEGIRAKLVELELPPEVMKMAEDLLRLEGNRAQDRDTDKG